MSPMQLPYLENILKDLADPLQETLEQQGLKPEIRKTPDGRWFLIFANKGVTVSNSVSLQFEGPDITNKYRVGWEDAVLLVNGNSASPNPILGTDWKYLPRIDGNAVVSTRVADLLALKEKDDFIKDLAIEVAAGKLIVIDKLHGREKITASSELQALSEVIAERLDLLPLEKVSMERDGRLETLRLRGNEFEFLVHSERGLLVAQDYWHGGQNFSRGDDPEGLLNKLSEIVERRLVIDRARREEEAERRRVERERQLEYDRIESEKQDRVRRAESARKKIIELRREWTFVSGGTKFRSFKDESEKYIAVLAGADQTLQVLNKGVSVAVIGVFGKIAKISFRTGVSPEEGCRCMLEALELGGLRPAQDPQYLGHVIDINGKWHPLDDLPNGLVVAGSCSFLGTQLTKLPDGMRVHGKLTLGSNMVALPVDLKAYSVDLRMSQVTVIRGDMMVRDMIYAAGSRVDTVEKGLVTGGVDLSRTNITSLPKGFDGGHLNVSWSRLKAYPRGMVVKSLTCEGIDAKLPSDFKIKEPAPVGEGKLEEISSAGAKI
jgi:hypothetical protein